MTPAHRADFRLRTELGGSRSKKKTPRGRLEPRSWTSPASQEHDGTPRHGAGAHSLWRGSPGSGFQVGVTRRRAVLLGFKITLDLDDLSVDGCITKAPCGGEVAGRSPVDRGKQGTKRPVASRRRRDPDAPGRRPRGRP